MPPIRFRLRRPLAAAALAALALLAPPLSAQPPRWAPLGPYGGTVTSLIVHPNDPRVLYAGAGHGILQTTDAGASWHRLDSFPGPGLVALDTARPRLLYAVTPEYPVRAFKSADGGLHWQAVSRNLPPDLIVTAFAAEPSPSSRLYLGTLGGGLWRSADGGVTWQAANRGLASDPSRWITVLAVPRRPSGTVFAGTRDGLYRTVNGGVSWTRPNRGLPAAAVDALAVSGSDPRTVYASLAGAGIYRSADGGASWAAAGVPAEGKAIDALAVHPRSPRTVYAGSAGGGLFKTADGGTHWTATTLAPTVRVRALALDPTPAAILYVGAAAPNPNVPGIDPGGVLRSADGGASWTRVNRGIAGLEALAAAIDPGDPEVLVAGMLGTGLFRTANAGARWSRTRGGLPATQNVGVIIPALLAPGVFYAVAAPATQPLWKSTDGGLTWSPLPGPGGQISLLSADPLAPETFYALASAGLARSADGGASWTVLSGTLPEMCFVADLAVVHPAAPQPPILYLAGARPGADPGGISTPCGTFRHAAVFRSVDGGASWVAADSGLPGEAGKSVAVIAADPEDPRALYVGMGDGADGVWKSVDAGDSWQPAGLGGLAITALAFPPVSGALWAGTPDKVFRSADGGASWQDRGGARGLFPRSLLFDPLNRRVYAAGGGGVWVSEQEP